MVQSSLSGSGRYLNQEWHDMRHKARTETFNIDEWGDIDIEKFDLDTVDFDRKKKDSTFEARPDRSEAEGSAQPSSIRVIPELGLEEDTFE